MQPQLFDYQWKKLKYIIQQNSLSTHFNMFGESSPKLCNFKINYLGNMENIYRSSILVYDQQQLKHNVELGIVPTRNTNISTK